MRKLDEDTVVNLQTFRAQRNDAQVRRQLRAEVSMLILQLPEDALARAAAICKALLGHEEC